METRLRIKSLITYMVNIVLRFNALDNQKERKHSYFSLELLDEEICYRITHKKTTTITTTTTATTTITNGVIHIASHLNLT